MCRNNLQIMLFFGPCPGLGLNLSWGRLRTKPASTSRWKGQELLKSLKDSVWRKKVSCLGQKITGETVLMPLQQQKITNIYIYMYIRLINTNYSFKFEFFLIICLILGKPKKIIAKYGFREIKPMWPKTLCGFLAVSRTINK